MTQATFHLRVNGSVRSVRADENAPLLDVLRNALDLKATRFGCGVGECGACHVLIDGVSVPACDTPVGTVGNAEIVTVEGLSHEGRPNGLQQAFIDEQAAQCGYCLSGILASATELLARVPQPT